MSRLQDMVTELSKDRSPHEEKSNMQLRTIEILVSEKAELQQELATVSEENKLNAGKFTSIYCVTIIIIISIVLFFCRSVFYLTHLKMRLIRISGGFRGGAASIDEFRIRH